MMEKLTVDLLLNKYKFELVVYESEECSHGVEYRKKLDRYNYLSIQDDFSFGIDELIGSDSLCFENGILDSCERLELIWKALTGKDII